MLQKYLSIFVQFLQKVFTDLSISVSTINLSFCPPRFEKVASSDMLTPEAPMLGYKIIQSYSLLLFKQRENICDEYLCAGSDLVQVRRHSKKELQSTQYAPNKTDICDNKTKRRNKSFIILCLVFVEYCLI